MPIGFFAFEWNYVGMAAVAVVVLFGLLLVPYLIKENRDGKRQLGATRHLDSHGVTLGAPPPPGAGDNNPGRVGDPAPGMPDGQADPWGERAQRDSTPVKS